MDIKDKYLTFAMLDAGAQCTHPVEEEGGIILHKNDGYVFAKIKNIHAGESIAAGLYETDQQELKEKVLDKMTDGWTMYASFHTHPSFSPTPSSLDLAKLFQGFKYNIIFAPRTNMYSVSEWVGEKTTIYYVPTETLKHLLEN